MATIVFRYLVELQKKDKERKINNENLELRSKRFLHKVNPIYLSLKKQAGYKYFGAVWNKAEYLSGYKPYKYKPRPKTVVKIDELWESACFA